MEEFKLTPEEINYFLSIEADERWLRAEHEKLALRKQNIFLKMSIRIKINLDNWCIDLDRGICMPVGLPLPARCQSEVQG